MRGVPAARRSARRTHVRFARSRLHHLPRARRSTRPRPGSTAPRPCRSTPAARPPRRTAGASRQLRHPAVIFHVFSDRPAALKRRSCSSAEMCSQNLAKIGHRRPACARTRRSRRGAPPLLLGREALDALDEHAAVPGAVEDGHATPSPAAGPRSARGSDGALVGRRRRERRDAHVARVQRGQQALDRAAFAGGVPALHDDGQRRSKRVARVQLAAEREAQLGEPSASAREPLVLVATLELQ